MVVGCGGDVGPAGLARETDGEIAEVDGGVGADLPDEDHVEDVILAHDEAILNGSTDGRGRWVLCELRAAAGGGGAMRSTGAAAMVW